MTTSDRTPPRCPSWCIEDHDPSDPYRSHTGIIATAPVEPEGEGAPDRVRIELQSFDAIEDGELQHEEPSLWLTLSGPAADSRSGMTAHAQVQITLDHLVRLVDGVQANLALPELARLALADQLGSHGEPKGEPMPALPWDDDQEDISFPPTAPTPSRPPATATLDEWDRQQTAEGYSTRTRDVRRKVVNLIAGAAGVAPHAVERHHVLDYLAARDLAPNTRRKYLQHVKAWSDFAGIPDPTAGIRRPPVPAGRPKPIDDDDLARLLNVATGRRRLFLMLGAYAGFRSFETAKVAIEDLVRLGDGTHQLRVLGKGGRLEVLPCNPALARAIEEYAQANDIVAGPLFPGASGKVVQSALRRLGRSTGVEFSSHQLRHWYGTAAHRASGGDLLKTQRLMRHTSPSTTAGYAAVSGQGLRDIVDSLAGHAGAPVPPVPTADGGRPGLRLLRGGV